MKNQFASADLTAGQLNAIVKKLGGHEAALKFLRGESRVVIDRHMIDLDAKPFCPDGWKVEEHKAGGQFEWDVTKIALHLADGQVNGIVGNDLRKLLAEKPVKNANLLDYFLKNPSLIPEEWKGKNVFFWGTIYRYPGGVFFVRCLGWRGVSWSWDGRWLDDGFVGSNPALIAAASQN